MKWHIEKLPFSVSNSLSKTSLSGLRVRTAVLRTSVDLARIARVRTEDALAPRNLAKGRCSAERAGSHFHNASESGIAQHRGAWGIRRGVQRPARAVEEMEARGRVADGCVVDAQGEALSIGGHVQHHLRDTVTFLC